MGVEFGVFGEVGFPKEGALLLCGAFELDFVIESAGECAIDGLKEVGRGDEDTIKFLDLL